MRELLSQEKRESVFSASSGDKKRLAQLSGSLSLPYSFAKQKTRSPDICFECAGTLIRQSLSLETSKYDPLEKVELVLWAEGLSLDIPPYSIKKSPLLRKYYERNLQISRTFEIAARRNGMEESYPDISISVFGPLYARITEALRHELPEAHIQMITRLAIRDAALYIMSRKVAHLDFKRKEEYVAYCSKRHVELVHGYIMAPSGTKVPLGSRAVRKKLELSLRTFASEPLREPDPVEKLAYEVMGDELYFDTFATVTNDAHYSGFRDTEVFKEEYAKNLCESPKGESTEQRIKRMTMYLAGQHYSSFDIIGEHTNTSWFTSLVHNLGSLYGYLNLLQSKRQSGSA